MGFRGGNIKLGGRPGLAGIEKEKKTFEERRGNHCPGEKKKRLPWGRQERTNKKKGETAHLLREGRTFLGPKNLGNGTLVRGREKRGRGAELRKVH